jgi:hypothetical protein
LFRGISPGEADINLLETARRCELYGAKLHIAQVDKLFSISSTLELTNI